MVSRRVWAGSLLLATLACGDGNPGGPSEGGGSGQGGGSGGPNRGTVTAVIDGVAYTGVVSTATNINGVINVTSNNAARTVSINFAGPAVVGTVSVNPQSALSLNVITTTGTTVTGSWLAGGLFGSGTLNINTLTSAGASGGFAFAAVPPPAGGMGATGTKLVSSGAFNVTF